MDFGLSSAASQARAKAKSRFTVGTETPRTSADSASVRPPKKRSSSTRLERLSAASGHVALEGKPVLPERVHIALRRQQELRYGENPHHAAALYVPAGRAPEGLAAAKQLQGKELSYNNFVDLEAARSLAAEFKNPAAVIIKHNNPCGTAEQATLLDAYLKALACDPVSAFGGVLAFNRTVDAETAREVSKLFVEAIAAPAYDKDALEIFAAKRICA